MTEVSRIGGPTRRTYSAPMSSGDPTDVHRITANGIEFAYLEQGEGPLALCLHGYPDSAYTWQHLLPELAAAGYRAVAPFNRGYAPTGLAPDGQYEAGTLGLDANALHEALGADGDAVLIGHDWGAMGVYAAAGVEPQRWRRVVAMAVPIGPVNAQGFFTYEQLKMSWYIFFQLNPLSDMLVAMNDYEFIAKLWADWSPGFDGTEYVGRFVESMATPEHLTAALSYYRHTVQGELQAPDHAAAQAMTMAVPTVPLLYLHGVDDGCMRSQLAATSADHLGDDSRVVMVEGAGHFLHLERPDVVNRAILEFLAG